MPNENEVQEGSEMKMDFRNVERHYFERDGIMHEVIELEEYDKVVDEIDRLRGLLEEKDFQSPGEHLVTLKEYNAMKEKLEARIKECQDFNAETRDKGYQWQLKAKELEKEYEALKNDFEFVNTLQDKTAEEVVTLRARVKELEAERDELLDYN